MLTKYLEPIYSKVNKVSKLVEIAIDIITIENREFKKNEHKEKNPQWTKRTKPFNNYKYFYFYNFCSPTERLTDKIFIAQVLFDQMNRDIKNQAFMAAERYLLKPDRKTTDRLNISASIFISGREKACFPLNVADIWTDIRMDKRTDICNQRVAPLLII